MARLCCTFVALASLLAACPSMAQAPAERVLPTTATKPQPPAEPTPIPAAEIPTRAEAASTHLRSLETRLQPEPAFVEINQALPERETLLEEARQRDAANISKLGLRELEDVRQSWARRKAELDAWQTTLQARLETLAQEQQTLDGMDATWRATRAASRSSNIPPALEQRTRTIVSEITQARTTLNTRFDELLALQDRVSRLQVIVGDVVNQIELATNEARNALLRLDSPPLWEKFRGGGKLELAAQLHESILEVRQVLIEWYNTFRTRIFIHAGVFVALAITIVVIRRRAMVWAGDDPATNAAMHVLERPISAALLIALMLNPTMYPRGSVVVGEIAALLLIVPMLRLLPALVYQPMRKPLYALAALYALSRLHTLVLPRSMLDRLLLLTVTALALVGLMSLLRPGSSTHALSKSRWWGLSISAAKIAALALTIALVANVIGAVALSELLTEATLASALIAAALLAGVLVIEGVVAIVLRTPRARVLHSVRTSGPLIEQRIAGALHFFAVLVWIVSTAGLLNILAPTGHALRVGLAARWTIGTMSLSVGDVLVFMFGLYLAVLVSRFITFLLREDVLPRLPLARGVPHTITMLVNYGIIALGFMLAVAAAGVDLTRLTIIAGAVGVGVGFGLQNVVNNFVSGLILAFERPVQIGDVIEVGTNSGEVRRIGLRSSTIRTGQGAEVIVPNAQLISNEVVNWTFTDRERRLELRVGVAYGNDPAKVIDILHDTLAAHEKVRSQPSPVITFDGFGESALNFTMRYWGQLDDMLRISSDVAIAVYQALTKAGIEIPVPQRDLRLREMPGTLKLAAPEADGPHDASHDEPRTERGAD
jgi:small-conductance mechanosensitive channel